MKILLLNGYLDFFVNSADFFIPKNVTFGPFKDNFFIATSGLIVVFVTPGDLFGEPPLFLGSIIGTSPEIAREIFERAPVGLRIGQNN